MTWDAYHRRKRALRDMLDLADRREPTTLAGLLDAVPGAREAFDDPRIALFDAQMLFVQRVRGEVDALLGDGLDVEGTTHEDAVVRAWAEAAVRMPGARRLLDGAEAEGDLAKAFAKERGLLATLAGVPPLHPDLLAHGERLRREGRELAAQGRPRPSHGTDGAPATAALRSRGGIIGRLREALAA